MGAAPAQAAGVEKIILCTPPRLHPKDAQEQEHAEKNNKKIALKPWADETTLAVSYICKIDTVYALGGAQAIAAMAYGTETIPQVDVIVGPGNKYVAEAKRLVYGKVGIDFIAGPTEVFIIADESARASWVAADLLAQAEHDPDAQAILATNSEKLIAEVKTEIQKQISLFPEPEAALQSLKENGLILLCKDLDEAIEIANKKAPEHLEIALDDTKERKKLVEKARNYGSLFIGHEAAEVFGDYCAGLNHTLPTSGSARFTGGLSVRHFIKTLTTLRAHNQESIQEIAKHSALIGRSEGLIGHARAAEIRFQNSQD
jgi:histidinol dehydrogenase